jgi:membrane glycosyltransferase
VNMMLADPGDRIDGEFRFDTTGTLNPPRPRLRRAAFFGLVLATIAAAAAMLFDILAANGLEPVEIAILVLFVVNFVWIALSFWTAVAGFIVRGAKLDPINLRPLEDLVGTNRGPISTRTAICVPVYNEDPRRVFAGIEAIYRSLETAGGLRHFDLFVLSDTRNEDIALSERQTWTAFCRKHQAENRIFYRRRENNTGRKAGNIADFCRRWGAAYDHMVVLDADSVMSGETLLQLVRLMEANPQAGLIQTQPMPFNQATLFGRALQFSCGLVGPVMASGVGFWSLGESNFYGHNAIIRTRAFIDHCGLPMLPGKPPLGGEIHSHDFVEAALMRRGGWSVYFVPDLGGSYEELPTNIVDYATRERRWCQGNLQHLRLVAAPGLHWVNRLHMVAGAFAFLSSPLWAAFLLLSTADIVERAITGHRYFSAGHQLFPDWPVSKFSETISLCAVTLGLLFLPKLFGLLLVLFDRRRRRQFGGGIRATLGLVIETLFSALIAPVMGGLHTYFIVSLVTGRGVAWNPQNRSDRGLSVGEVTPSLGLLFAVGMGWLAVLLVHAPEYLWWVLPVLTGLILAMPVAVISSRRSVGQGLRRLGLLVTPEETTPAPELRDLAAALARAPSPEQRTRAKPLPTETPPAQWTPMEPQRLHRRTGGRAVSLP